MPQERMAMSLILLVDESPVFLTVYKQFLKTVPASLLAARRADEALELCRQHKPNLIYMSFDLPDMNGAECCRQIKGDPHLRTTPVVLICDGQRPEQQQSGRQAGCDGLLNKPVERHRFLSIGKDFLAGIREVRRSCLVTVRCLRQGRNFNARGLDICSGGIFVETSEVLEEGEFLQLDIQLCRPSATGSWIKCTGAVAWRNERERPCKPSHPVGFGVRFTAMSVEDSGALSDFLEKL